MLEFGTLSMKYNSAEGLDRYITGFISIVDGI